MSAPSDEPVRSSTAFRHEVDATIRSAVRSRCERASQAAPEVDRQGRAWLYAATDQQNLDDSQLQHHQGD